MKFKVIRGLRSAMDYKGKSRFAVILEVVSFNKDEWVFLLPCTSYPARTGKVPAGSVLLTSASPAYKGSGFTGDSLAISFRDAAIYRKQSSYLEDAVEVGTLNLGKDNRFRDEWLRVKKQVNLSQARHYKD